MSNENILEQIDKLAPWFHNLHFPDGTQTAPNHFLGDFPHYKWLEIEPFLPKDIRDMRVLDIGCNAGYYSLELAKRGAQVTAIDIDEHYLKQALWAADTLDLIDRIEFRQASIYDLARAQESYDLVLFMGVLYHLRYPMLALDSVRRCCTGSMIFQTMTSPGDEVFTPEADYGLDERAVMTAPGWPTMAFIEHRLAGDPTNWWAPNHACIEAMLRSTGFADIENIGHEIYRCTASTPVSVFAQAELSAVIQYDQKYSDSGRTAN